MLSLVVMVKRLPALAHTGRGARSAPHGKTKTHFAFGRRLGVSSDRRLASPHHSPPLQIPRILSLAGRQLALRSFGLWRPGLQNFRLQQPFLWPSLDAASRLYPLTALAVAAQGAVHSTAPIVQMATVGADCLSSWTRHLQRHAHPPTSLTPSIC